MAAENGDKSLTVSSLFANTDFLIRNSGDKVEIGDLKEKIVGIYFSAHWCPPCRAFTPSLAEVYGKLKSKGDFEIVFVSADEDVKGFEEYFSEMPWLAVPFSDQATRDKLDEAFAVSGIPYLVILGKDGEVLTLDGVETIQEFEAEAYPFSQQRIENLRAEAELARANQTLESLLVSEERDFVIGHDGKKVPVSELVGKTIGLYFSAHWCGPCRSFTPMLVKLYDELREKGEAFEVVFCSSDRSEKSFEEYYESMPWLALPFGDKTRKKLSSYFDVSGIPTLIIIGPDGKTVQTETVGLIREYGIKAYPFTFEKVQELEEEENAKRRSATLESLLTSESSNFVIKHGGEQVPLSELKGKTVGLYFSAHWCPPCRNFTPKLVSVYNEIKEKGEAFEIVFVPFDHDEESYQEYYSTMPWLSLPLDDERKRAMSRTLQVKGIPTLIVANPDGKFVSFDAVNEISIYGSKAYPFDNARLEHLKKEIDELATKSPKEIKHESHEHALVLTERQAYCCDSCDEGGVAWSYNCKECDYDLHISCAQDQKQNQDSDANCEVEVPEPVSEENKVSGTIVCDGDVCRRI